MSKNKSLSALSLFFPLPQLDGNTITVIQQNSKNFQGWRDVSAIAGFAVPPPAPQRGDSKS
jgi:hypothetical protein